MKKVMDGNGACSYVSYMFQELSAIYPITPISPSSEAISLMSVKGRRNFFGSVVDVLEMQSEAGAVSVIHGALQNGVLASTYTSSQGLLLMLPTLYKMVGEMLPGVINVASRSLSTHALSIFGDHQDINAVRSSGVIILVSSSVQEVMDLTSVSYLSALDSSFPVINSFDGFRTSHELNKIEVIDLDRVKSLINFENLEDFRKRALSKNKVTRGTNQNEDVYFQITEARNKEYEKVSSIVKKKLNEISLITGRNYKPFNFYGDENATKVIVAMGSVCETIKEYLEYENSGLGLVEVHLYRPFSIEYFLEVFPETTEVVAVLDRTNEESPPLYLDVQNALFENNVEVFSGIYGLSSKNVSIFDVAGIYKFLDEPFNNFKVGIQDELAITPSFFEKEKEEEEILVYGFGSDGMVSASKNLIEALGNEDFFVQGYFEYDSKKSGGITKSHLRRSLKSIKSAYLVENPSLVVVSKDSFLLKLDIFKNIKEDGTVLINTIYNIEELCEIISDEDKELIKEKNLNIYLVNAYLEAKVYNLSFLNMILIGALLKIKDLGCSLNSSIKEVLETRFSQDELKKTLKAMKEVKVQKINNKDLVLNGVKKSVTFYDLFLRDGKNLSVKELKEFRDGTFQGGKSYLEKRDITEILPSYNKENCIQCSRCALMCPHGVIRPFIISKEEYENSLYKERFSEAFLLDDKYYVIGINFDKCTGCGMCVNVCPGKKGEKALLMKEKAIVKTPEKIKFNESLFKNVKNEQDLFERFTVKGSQLVSPKFEYSGACSGCGETPYLKLLTQLFDNLVIANATGCSSIYGGSVPYTPYSVPWMSSLFEDNAEFGLGLKLAEKKRIENIILDLKSRGLSEGVYQDYILSFGKEKGREVKEALKADDYSLFEKYENDLISKVYFLVGGDGWAYDIGFSGIDHVMSMNEDVNILVLDTETYSNTGGQSSKSSNFGTVLKFADSGKKTYKKPLSEMMMLYPNAYVSQISLYANPNAAIKAFKEAVEHDGPSLIVAYAPCISHKVIGDFAKGKGKSLDLGKAAVSSGYFPIFRKKPKESLIMDSGQVDFDKLEEFLLTQERFSNLFDILDEEEARDVLEKLKISLKERYEGLVKKGDSDKFFL